MQTNVSSRVLLRLLLLALPLSTAAAQSAKDEAALRELPKQIEAAWAKHDGHALAALMSDDIDWVNVGAVWLKGKKDFETYHTRLLSGRFRESTFTPQKVFVRFLRPDVALVRFGWAIRGDKDFDGKPRPPRWGILTLVAQKRDGRWLIESAQNTNYMPGRAPEEKGIRSPIEFPE